MTPLILTLNEHGTPTHWSTWQDAVTYKVKDVVAWETGDWSWTKHGGENKLSGNRSRVSFSSIIAVRGTHHPKRKPLMLTNRTLFGRDLNICAYCGEECEYRDLTNDHITPKSRGGGHTWMNCVTSCRRCNNKKDDRLLEECGMSLLYLPYIPCREEGLIMCNRKILADQMEFLKSALPSHSRLRAKLT